MARGMSWDMNTQTLGLSLLTVNVGLSGMKFDAAGVSEQLQKRALIESAVLASVAAYLSRNWWPVVFPTVYLGFDYLWSNRRGHAPQILASEDKAEYLEYANGS